MSTVKGIFFLYPQVTDSCSAYLCDLGVAKLQNQLATIHTFKGVGAGTVPYKAPEMFHDCRRTAAVDIYSMGCVLIELLAERKIWPDLDTFQIQHKVCGSQPEPPSMDGVPDECKDICMSCTRIEASERPTALYLLQSIVALLT